MRIESALNRKESILKVLVSLTLLVIILFSSSVAITNTEYAGDFIDSRKTITPQRLGVPNEVDITQEDVPIGAIGIPYVISLAVGNSTFYKYYLEKEKTYLIDLYGGFVGSKADYDIYVYNKNFTRLKLFASDPGDEEFGTFTSKNTSYYYIQVVNNPITSKEINYAVLLVLEQVNLTRSEKSKSILLTNFSGGNKTNPVKEYNSSYGYFIKVAELQNMNITFSAKPTSDLEIELALFQFTSTTDKLAYTSSNIDKSESLIDSAKGSYGKEVNVSFIVGRRGNEHTNDTNIVLFVKALRGTGNVTLTISMKKTNIQIDLLPYLLTIASSVVILAVIGLSEEKLRG